MYHWRMKNLSSEMSLTNAIVVCRRSLNYQLVFFSPSFFPFSAKKQARKIPHKIDIFFLFLKKSWRGKKKCVKKRFRIENSHQKMGRAEWKISDSDDIVMVEFGAVGMDRAIRSATITTATWIYIFSLTYRHKENIFPRKKEKNKKENENEFCVQPDRGNCSTHKSWAQNRKQFLDSSKGKTSFSKWGGK